MKTEAIILAGGMGTRLRGVVSDRPKVLASVNHRPFITYLLDQLAEVGVESVVVSTGYKAEMVEAQIGSSYSGLRVRYSRENETLGTGGGMKLALCRTDSDPVLVLNGDSYCAVDLRGLVDFHQFKNASVTLTLAQVADSSRFGRVETEQDGSVICFEEKGGSHSVGWINAGVYCMRREVLEAIPQGQSVSVEREIFPTLISKNLYGFKSDGKFLDIGTPESYAAAEDFFA